MKVEYLIVISKKKEMCTTKESFLNLLKSNPNLSINGETIKYKNALTAKYHLQRGEIKKEEESIYYHISLESNEEENVDEFSNLLKSIRIVIANMGDSNIQTLWDDVTLYYSIKAYPIIHNIENLMRKLITKFMIVNVGNQWISNTLPDDLKTSGNKKPERNINLLYNTDFIELSKFLFDQYRTIDTAKLIEKISSLADCSSKELEEIKSFIPKSNWERYFNDQVDCEADYLLKRWEKLYILRCAVAHNNTFHKTQYNDLIKISTEVEEKLSRAINQLDKVKIPDIEREGLAEEYAISVNEVTGNFINTWKKTEQNLLKIAKTKLDSSDTTTPSMILKSLEKEGIISQQIIDNLLYYKNIRNNIVHSINSDLSLDTIEKNTLELDNINSKLVDALYSDNYFWINSNIKYSGDTWKEMLNKNIACTYGVEKYGNQLRKLQVGDLILLYISERGIIAGGLVSEEFSGSKNTPALTIDEKLAEEMPEYSVGVNWKYKLSESSIIDVKKIRECGQNHFVGTSFRVNAEVGYKLFEEMEKRLQ
jgi:uncharacterized protein YutE (UPF0331/DUF86 family)